MARPLSTMLDLIPYQHINENSETMRDCRAGYCDVYEQINQSSIFRCAFDVPTYHCGLWRIVGLALLCFLT